MKKIIICLLATLAGGIFFSCNKTSPLMYSSVSDGIKLQLGITSFNPDSVAYNFAYKSTNPTDSILFTGLIVGKAADHDRTFFLKAIAGDTTSLKAGTDYVFGTYVIKKNAYQGYFAIYIKRTTNFLSKPARLVFGLTDKGELKSGIIEQSKLVVNFSNVFSKPGNWDVDAYPYNKLATYFGSYSNVKFQFITTAIGQPPIFRVRSSGTPGAGEIDYTTVTYYKNTCKVQLANYNAANPTAPLKDENNNLVTFP